MSSVSNIINESFHEHRPSFRSILAQFEDGNAFRTSSHSLRKLLKQQKSVRTTSKHSFASCSTDLGNIDEDCEEEEEEVSDVGEMMNGMPEKIIEENIEHNLEKVTEELQNSFIEDIDLGEESETSEESEAPPEQEKGPVFPKGNFADDYELGEELGAGAYAVVKNGTHRETKKIYAIKIVEIECMDQADFDALQIEINVMSNLNHPNIIRLYETYREDYYYYMVTERMVGGELLDRIVQKTFYNEKEARDTCLILFEAMRYCHSHGIAHRDLKPENLLLLSNDNDSNIKIADFGFAKKCPSTGLRTMCGTPGYVAPEILERKPYDTQCDLWSLGVIVYILLGGYSPFEEPTQEELFRKIRAGKYTFHVEFWDPVSQDAKDFINCLLTVNPRKRLNATQALQHEWMTKSGDILENQDLGANLTELKRYNAKRKFKAAVKTIIATQKLSTLLI